MTWIILPVIVWYMYWILPKKPKKKSLQELWDELEFMDELENYRTKK